MPEWNSKGYPKEYLASLQEPDNTVIRRVLDHLQSQKSHPNRVAAEYHDDGVVVYTVEGSGDSMTDSYSSINWARPNNPPSSYPGYASTFWRFYGPEEIQIRRAKLLAAELGGWSTREKYALRDLTLEIPSLGYLSKRRRLIHDLM